MLGKIIGGFRMENKTNSMVWDLAIWADTHDLELASFRSDGEKIYVEMRELNGSQPALFKREDADDNN